MKKILKLKNMIQIAILILLYVLYHFVLVPAFENSKIDVALHECIDGDTAIFDIDNTLETVRFLVVDAPERNQTYYDEAANLTCSLLSNSDNIMLEMDKNATLDNYNRVLGWIWVDDTLIQQHLLESGYAKIAYVYDDYKYTNQLRNIEKQAQENKLGLWSVDD